MQKLIVQLLLLELLNVFPVGYDLWEVMYKDGNRQIQTITLKNPNFIIKQDISFNDEEYDPLSETIYLSPSRFLWGT